VIKINADCFFVKPQNTVLLDLIKQNGFVMLHGHREIGMSGKKQSNWEGRQLKLIFRS
jgi:hypothetical protein